MRLTIMCGLPDSGKTTKANEIAAETGAVCLHHDSYYSGVLSGAVIVTPEMLRRVFLAVYADIREHLHNGEDVIYDSVCGSRQHRRELIEIAHEAGAEIVCVFMDTPKEVCLARSPLSWSRVIAIEPPSQDEGFEELVTVTYSASSNEEGQT